MMGLKEAGDEVRTGMQLLGIHTRDGADKLAVSIKQAGWYIGAGLGLVGLGLIFLALVP